MDKKLKTTDTDLSVTTSAAMIVMVGAIKFVKDERYPWIDVYLTGGEHDEFMDQIDDDNAAQIVTFNDFTVFAINWVFDNVEIVKEIEALE